MNTDKRDGRRLNLTKEVETFAPMEDDGRWKPSEGGTMTGEYGKGTPKPSPTLEGMAVLDVQEYYPYLLKDSPEFERRVKEMLARYL